MKFVIFALCLATLVVADDFFQVIPPIANQRFPEIAQSLNYPVETHYIQTSDGYINTYFRIQAKGTQMRSGLPVIYLQHGLMDSSDNWVINSEDLAPGLILANKGYDVWCGNIRGNRYSTQHVKYDSSDATSKYWDFSWQEISEYDIPAAFQYIHDVTGQNIYYIGHSQGTTVMFAALARRDPVVLKYLIKYFALGPVTFVDHSTSPLLKAADRFNIPHWLMLADQQKFGFLSPFLTHSLELTCKFDVAICAAGIKSFSDFKPEVDNLERMDIYIGHFPAGTSMQNMEYWNQMTLNTKFQYYNYGNKGNQNHYNNKTVPYYDLSQINVPVYLYSGIWDELADPQDVKLLHDALTGSPYVEWKSYPYGHATFMWGKDVDYLEDLLAVIENEA